MSLVVAGEARLDWTELLIWTEQEKETSTTWKLEFGRWPFVDDSLSLYGYFWPCEILHFALFYLVVSAVN